MSPTYLCFHSTVLGYIFFLSFLIFINQLLKACVCYFSSMFYFKANDSPSKTMNNVFYFIKSSFHSWDIQIYVFLSSPLFLPVRHCFRGWLNINLIVCHIINSLNKNLITYFVWYLGKEKRYDIETLLIDRVLNKKYFYGKIMQKMCTKS